MKFEDFQTAEDLVRQYNESVNLISILENNIVIGDSSNLYLSVNSTLSGATQILTTDIAWKNVSEDVKNTLKARKELLLEKMNELGLDAPAEPPTPVVTPDPSVEVPGQPSTDAPATGDASNQSDSTTTPDAPTTTDSGTPSGDPNPPVVPEVEDVASTEDDKPADGS